MKESDTDRIESLLVMILLNSLKGSNMAEKVRILNLAGFNNLEIANYLETSGQTIASLIYQTKKKKSTKKKGQLKWLRFKTSELFPVLRWKM